MKAQSISILIILLLLFFGCVDQLHNPHSLDTHDIQDVTGTSVQLTQDIEFTGNYIVLSRTPSLPPGLVNAILAKGITIVNAFPEVGAIIITGDEAIIKDEISTMQGVRSIIPDLEYQFDMPEPYAYITIDELGDPPFSGSGDRLFDLQWGHTAVRAHHAWAEGVRGAGVKVAVLDTGYDLTHPDLEPNVDFVFSENFVPGETLQYTAPGVFSHGSHVAGTIAAAENDFGIIGVAPDATLILIKVLRDTGSGAFSWIMEGILHATNVGADIINMSLGGYLRQRGFFDSQGNFISASTVAELRVLMNRVVNYAYQNNVTIIAAAMNDGLDRDTTTDLLILPADMPNVITISATTPIGWALDPENAYLDNFASYSNYGITSIDFSAPGGDILYDGGETCTISGMSQQCRVFDLVFSTGAGGGWYWSAGTSMAAPHVSGIAALIISENGGPMNPHQVKAKLRQHAEKIGSPGHDPQFGMGRVSSGY